VDAAKITGGTQDVYAIVGNIINVILSLLGLIFLLLVLYAGFLWMTAQGDSKKVDEAKTIIRQAIIGLIVIMAGYAISNFVLGSLANVTGAA
jgi:cbb3-type cytochrome oxidase subunit 3